MPAEPKPEGAEYLGIARPYWLRLTDDGVGVHVGGFERGHCTSHGCIRCPRGCKKESALNSWQKTQFVTNRPPGLSCSRFVLSASGSLAVVSKRRRGPVKSQRNTASHAGQAGPTRSWGPY